DDSATPERTDPMSAPNKLSLAALWGSFITVDSAGWTPNALQGFFWIDAAMKRWEIIGNTADTVYFNPVDTPVLGHFGIFTSPGWTAQQFLSRYVGSVF